MSLNSVRIFLMLSFTFILPTISIHFKKHFTNVAHTIKNSMQQSTINFSNYDWQIRVENTPAFPGPNCYSNSEQNIWIDEKQYLHMKIRNQGEKWFSSQVNLLNTLGYGSYIFSFQKGLGLLDANTALYLFINLDNKHQIQIDISQWGNPKNLLNSQYAITPQNIKGNYMRFPLWNNQPIIHSFTWTKNYILFQSFYAKTISQIQNQIGKISTSEALQIQWKYTGNSIPVPNNQNVVIAFWLLSGKPPTNGLNQEIIVKEFKHISLKK